MLLPWEREISDDITAQLILIKLGVEAEFSSTCTLMDAREYLLVDNWEAM